MFQCSSASRKFLNRRLRRTLALLLKKFQCSSASRKFLNWNIEIVSIWIRKQFQCSSASRKFLNSLTIETTLRTASKFQCSSASRKFLNRMVRWCCVSLFAVSVLFSEPKIPQSQCGAATMGSRRSFSALQRAENSSIVPLLTAIPNCISFSALQRAENSSMV